VLSNIEPVTYEAVSAFVMFPNTLRATDAVTALEELIAYDAVTARDELNAYEALRAYDALKAYDALRAGLVLSNIEPVI